MIPVELALRPAQAEHPPHAFLIASDDPRLWLEVLIESGCPAATTRLFILPASPQDPRPAALLAVPPAGHAVHVPPRALGYAAVADRLFHPVNSTPYPTASPAEYAAALTWEINIFHPGLGLVGLHSRDAIALAELLAPPARYGGTWNLAVPGIAPPQALSVVAVEQPPDLTVLLDQGRGDIATENPQELPRDPRDPVLAPLIKNGMMFPLALAAAALDSLRRLFTRGSAQGSQNQGGQNTATPRQIRPGSEGAGGGLAGWLQKFFAALPGGGARGKKASGAGGLSNFISRHLNEQRRRELQRLLEMLSKSPDEGLRYAIPLGHPAAPRGLGTPGGSLTPRDLRFTLDALRGGRPIDPWDIPGDVQARLRADYRRLANRELALGRHRRAAYIFAQLLGDISAAASALQQGRFYRDAAALYQERLNQPLQAAACLEEGGLLTEAIELYNTLGMHEKVGDLYTKLEQHDLAASAYRAQVQRFESARQFLAAAALLETKLRAPDEALALLDGTWPSAGDAVACLEEGFALRARLARHPDAGLRLAGLAKNPPPPALAAPLVQIFARLAGKYPDADLRARAADAARVLAGNTLKTAPPEQAAQLVTAVTSLDADDRLLPRDGQRFLKTFQPRAKSRPARSTVRIPRLVREFPVSVPLVRFSAAFPLGSEFVLIGHSLVDVTVVFCNWGGGYRLVHLPHYFREPPKNPRFLATPHFLNNKLASLFLHEFTTLLHTPMAQSVQVEKVLPPLASPKAGPLLGMCADNATQTLWTLTQQNDTVLTAWNMVGGTVRSTRSMDEILPIAGFTFDPEQAGEIRPAALPHVPMISRNDHLFFALRNRVIHLAYQHRAGTFATNGNILSMTAADPLSRTRVAVVAEEECRLITSDGRDHRFAEGMYRPLTTFTRGGALIACDGHELRMYRTESERFIHDGARQRDRDRPLALLPTDVTDQFAAIDTAGNVQVFEIDA